MDNSTVMYIAVFAAVVAVIALIMIWQVRSFSQSVRSNGTGRSSQESSCSSSSSS